MKEHKPRFISIARINAKIDAFTNGVMPQDLDAEADKVERRITDKKGRQSEDNFKRISHKIPEVKDLLPSTGRENREHHTDFWILLQNPILGRNMLPIEIKSSAFGVNEVKNDADFKRNGLVLVVNSGKRRQDTEIVKNFREELQRVSTLLKNLKS